MESSSGVSKTKKILIIVLCVLAALFIGCGAYIGIYVSRIWSEPDFEEPVAMADNYEEDPEASGLPELTADTQGVLQQVTKTMGDVDILLLGVDNRSRNQFSGRSDVVMYLRIETGKKSLKLVSLMRDTLVNLKGHSDNKLNTAYRFGGIKLAKQTISDNFGLDPDYYIVVNFYGMEDIIDALGGVDIKLNKNEIGNLNKCIDEINAFDKRNKAAHVKKHGVQHLNGRQAVGYMRIRHIGNGDEGRIERQQAVMTELFNKAKDIELGQITGLISTCVEYVRTDIPIPNMLEIAEAVKGMNAEKLQTYSYPKNYRTGSYKGMSVVKPKGYEAEIEKLKEFLEK